MIQKIIIIQVWVILNKKKINEKESDNSDNDAENEEDKNENLDDN